MNRTDFIKDTTNSELIQKIKQHIPIEEKEFIKLKKESLIVLFEYIEMQQKDSNNTTTKGSDDTTKEREASLNVMIDHIDNTYTITLTGYKDEERVSQTIESLTKEDVDILSTHVYRKIGQSTKSVFEFVATPKSITIESFIEALKQEQENKVPSNTINELKVLINE